MVCRYGMRYIMFMCAEILLFVEICFFRVCVYVCVSVCVCVCVCVGVRVKHVEALTKATDL